jgi:hypothetical protein
MAKKKTKTRHPSYAVASINVGSKGRITPEMIWEAYNKLKNHDFSYPEFSPTGPFQRCFLNVQECVEGHDGEMVLGWQVDQNSGAAQFSENCFAKINLEAHAVWKTPDGRLVEVTNNPEKKAYPFIIHDKVQPFTDGSIQFVDSFILARAIRHFDPKEEKKIRRIIIHAGSREVRS